MFYLEPPGRMDHIQSSQIPFIPAYMYMDQGMRFVWTQIKIPSGLDNSFMRHTIGYATPVVIITHVQPPPMVGLQNVLRVHFRARL